MAIRILSVKTEWQVLLQLLFYVAYMDANVLHYYRKQLLENISSDEDACKIFCYRPLQLQL